ncbi:MAG: GNAT family N-acetyltransferase [Defluviitaleaceae bacterium]|nr:GNAT family N-acetyltransferase [Defluviitaleaceae bacterium]
MNHDILLYEELSMNALPALRTQLCDGWALRFADGYTYRANSVNPIYAGSLGLSFEEKAEFCERLYAGAGLPAVYKLTEASPAGLDGYLAERGYEILHSSYIFTKALLPGGSHGEGVSGAKLVMSDKIYISWLEDMFKLEEISDGKTAATAAAMLRNINNSVLCARIMENGKAAACGMCVIERGYAGLYFVAVDAEHRRRGFGHDICQALLNGAAKAGAKGAYLQVSADNAPAMALYEKLGFGLCYRYWYRVKL